MTEQAQAEHAFWRRCSNCKQPIALGAKYWICSVTTCQRVRAPIQFCKPDCWAVHNEVENHRDGWAIEKIAPKTLEETSAPSKSERSEKKTSSTEGTNMSDEVLVVVSRLKEHIQQKGGLRTSDEVATVLSEHLRRVADAAVESAKKDGRKTVLARDVSTTPANVDTPALVVVSRMKQYIASKGEMRTSDEVMPLLSEEVRRKAEEGMEAAKKDGRKTVLARDVGGAAT